MYNGHLSSQEYSFFSLNNKLSTSDSCKRKLLFVFNNNNFLKNNEYFNPIDEGITYLGAVYNPYLSLVNSNKITINAGWYGILYSGRNKISVSVPYYNVTWKFYDGYFLKIGNINGFHFHRLPEPLYSNDHIYSKMPESGIQIAAERKHHSTDIWLNWENFILPGDNTNELFVMGGRSFIYLKGIDSEKNIALTLNGMAAHKGGQVGSGGNIVSLLNSAIGLMYFINPHSGNIDSAGVRNDFYGYNDVSPLKQQLYSKGWGNYSTAFIKTNHFFFEGGFWYGRHFIASRGEWLFQSVSNLYTVYWEPSNRIITGKAAWYYEADKNINAGIGGGLYYDINSKNTDFYYQFHLIINLSFLIKEFPK